MLVKVPFAKWMFSHLYGMSLIPYPQQFSFRKWQLLVHWDLPGKLVSFHNASCTASGDTGADASELDSGVDITHQGSLFFPENMFCGSAASVLGTVCSWRNQMFINCHRWKKRKIQKTGKYTVTSIKLVHSCLEDCWGENRDNNCYSSDVLTFTIRVLLGRLSTLY